MKRIRKSGEPIELKTYRRTCPASEWGTMRNDALHAGKAAYDAIVAKLEADQGEICAYCEIKISREKHTTRVEHFVPKALQHTRINWALHWYNLLAVCNGGSQNRSVPGHYLEPLKENLSCDAHKQLALGTIFTHPVLLNPLSLPAMQPLMRLDHATGELRVDEANATSLRWPSSPHVSGVILVERSIEILNLNCPRLSRARLMVLRALEKEIKQARLKGLNPSFFMPNLVKRYLGPRFREFFSVYRFRLGDHAEIYLHSIGFNG
jgi:uncharacterized protein (TIGR02646 family)